MDVSVRYGCVLGGLLDRRLSWRVGKKPRLPVSGSIGGGIVGLQHSRFSFDDRRVIGSATPRISRGIRVARVIASRMGYTTRAARDRHLAMRATSARGCIR